MEFKEPVNLAKVSLHLGIFPYEPALNMRVETSPDGKVWKKMIHKYSPGEFIKNLIQSPRDPVQNIFLDGKKLKYLKLVQVGYNKEFWWSVTNLEIYKKSRVGETQ